MKNEVLANEVRSKVASRVAAAEVLGVLLWVPEMRNRMHERSVMKTMQPKRTVKENVGRSARVPHRKQTC